VSSVAAALASAHPEWTIFDIADAIRITASNSQSPDNDRGWGIVDAYGALMFCSVTGSVRWSDTGEALSSYPVSVQVTGASPVTVLTNDSGWFAVDPGVLGDFIVRSAGGPGNMIEVEGQLDSTGVEIEVFVDPLQSRSSSSVFPNPSMEGIYLGFDIEDGPVDVTFSVHTMTGEMVHIQERAMVPDGIYRAPMQGEAFYWDGLDDSGDRVSSGIYLARLVKGDSVEIIKFSMVR
jgi:hypothetical protein